MLNINIKNCVSLEKGELVSGFLDRKRKQRAQQFLDIDPTTDSDKAQLLLNNFTLREESRP